MVNQEEKGNSFQMHVVVCIAWTFKGYLKDTMFLVLVYSSLICLPE